MIKIIYIAYFVWISIVLLRNEITKPETNDGPSKCRKEWTVSLNGTDEQFDESWRYCNKWTILK